MAGCRDSAPLACLRGGGLLDDRMTLFPSPGPKLTASSGFISISKQQSFHLVQAKKSFLPQIFKKVTKIRAGQVNTTISLTHSINAHI